MKPAPKPAASCKRLEWDSDPENYGRFSAMTEWWACLCEAKLSGRAMRLAGFVRAEHNSITGGVWHKQETIQKYLRGHDAREVRYAREELRISGFLVREWDAGERRLVWFPATPNQKAEKKSGTNRSSKNGTNGSSPEEPTVPPKAEPTVPPKAEPLVPHILEGSQKGSQKPTGSISEQSESAPASGGRADQPSQPMAMHDARKDETMNPTTKPSPDEQADVDDRVQRYLDQGLSRFNISRRIAEVTENALGVIDPTERRQNELKLFALQVALEVKKRQAKKEKAANARKPARVSNRAS